MTLKRCCLILIFIGAALSAVGLCGQAAVAQEKIQIASLDKDLSGHPVMLDAYLFKPTAPDTAAPFPAVVFLHGCGGLINHTGKILSRETDWAQRLTEQGYVVLAVDSFTSRGASSECARAGSVTPDTVRPFDAYGALRFLQTQPYVKADRIALIGWSHGGGTVLFSIGPHSPGHQTVGDKTQNTVPAASDFRAAIAFYPGWCNAFAQHASSWNTAIPLLILQGQSDVWTRAQPCEDFAQTVHANGMPVEIHLYPDAYHDFDFPNLPVSERPEFAKRNGATPITGTNPTARADAIERVTAYLEHYLKH